MGSSVARTLALLATIGVCRAALADGATSDVDLRWIAPAECPSREAMLAAIANIRGAPGEAHGEVTASAVVVHEGARWHAQVTTRTSQGAGERTFEADSCVAIARAVSLIVALAANADAARIAVAQDARTLDEDSGTATAVPGDGGADAIAPEAGVQPPVSPPDAEVTPPPERPSSSPDRVSASGSPHATRGLRLATSVSGGADSATLPSPTPGIQVTAGAVLVRPAFTARLDGTASYWATRSATIPSRSSEGGNFTLATLGARLAVARRWGALELGPALGAEVDVISVTAFGGSVDRGGSGAWGALVGGGAASFALTGNLAMRLEGDAVVAPAPPTFVVELPPPLAPLAVHRPATVSARVFAGAELRFF